MRTLANVFILILLLTLHVKAQRQTQPQRPGQDTTRAVVQVKPVETLPLVVAKLTTFKNLITPENYRRMGFESPEEINNAKIDPPLKDFMVRLDHLKAFSPGSDPNYLLVSTGQQIFPISVNNEVRSSMILKQSIIFWKAVSYGSPNLIRQITNTVNESIRRTGMPRSAYFVVRIPAMNLIFLGYRTNIELFLVPMADDRRQRYRAFESQPAERIFSMILPEAREHDGLPR